MRDNSPTQSVFFPELFDRNFVARFDAPAGTSDGGAVLLKAIDERLGLTAAVAAAVCDPRQPGKVQHSLLDLIRQRVFGVACGYADANDVARIGDDPVQKLLLGRDPLIGDELASQSTLSRFENGLRATELLRMGLALADVVLAHHRRRLGRKVRRITIDLDPTDDPAHGNQQGVLFNGHYDSWCYLPLLAFVSFGDEPEQHLVGAVLRHGLAVPTHSTFTILKQLIARLQRLFPKARILVRLDGGFASPRLLGFLEGQRRIDYLVGLPQNKVLVREIEPLMVRAIAASARSGESAAFFGEFRYAAKTWRFQRRVIAKAEVVCHPGREARSNPRFVVTNLRHRPERVYEIYRQRGEVENRIKEAHDGLEIDRTSCHRFVANQLRLILTVMACVLMQELRRLVSARTDRRPQIGSLRLMLLKIGGRIERSSRRIVLHLAEHHAWAELWCAVARKCGAIVT